MFHSINEYSNLNLIFHNGPQKAEMMSDSIEIVLGQHGIELHSPKAWGVARVKPPGFGGGLFGFVVIRMGSSSLHKLGKT